MNIDCFWCDFMDVIDIGERWIDYVNGLCKRLWVVMIGLGGDVFKVIILFVGRKILLVYF